MSWDVAWGAVLHGLRDYGVCFMAQGGNEFNAIRISLASPEQIRVLSYGEIMKPETINYRTLRPEKDGLFCEKIFGPTKDWECQCGKYKKLRHKGIICDRCGVEVARAKVRRERMGHISLAAPVAHIWFSKGTPSRLGLMLDLSPKNLDRVLYFAQYLITGIDEDKRADAINKRHRDMNELIDRMDLPQVVIVLKHLAIRYMYDLVGKFTGSIIGEDLKKAADDLVERAMEDFEKFDVRDIIKTLRAFSDGLLKADIDNKERSKVLNDIEDLIWSIDSRNFREMRELAANVLDNLVNTFHGSIVFDELRDLTDILLGYLVDEFDDSIVAGDLQKFAYGLQSRLKDEFDIRHMDEMLRELANNLLDEVDADDAKYIEMRNAVAELARVVQELVEAKKKLDEAIGDLELTIDRIAETMENSEDALKMYMDEVKPLRGELYVAPDDVDEGVSGDDWKKYWKDVARRYDRFSEGVASTLRDVEGALDEFLDDVFDNGGRVIPDEGERKCLKTAISSIGRFSQNIEELEGIESLTVGALLTEGRFRDLRFYCEDVFTASMGAEAVLALLVSGNIDGNHDERYCAEIRGEGKYCHYRRDVCSKECFERGDFCISVDCLQQEIRETSGQRHKKAVKRMRVVDAFRKSENKPEWMIFTALPVLPPELRPMVQLDGGRFATSDLNDLYRRVINRNNRLRRLMDLQAPEIIVRNEKRMLQEAVDALVDNGRRGRAVAGSHNHKLKSLSDLLRGKQGRFRQNLLGKRVDYSGRSVIIVGPELKLSECGLPRKMALELFKPFVMNKLVIKGYAHNIKSAKRLAESERPEVWDILEEVVEDRPVLLNRAPTLHRLGIQAFQPVLIEGNAIRLHPLVTTAFNADFDGDQMAVHVPLSKEAVWEARKMMMSTYNMLAPSSGEPIVAPTLDMVLGCFYLTQALRGSRGEGKVFSDIEDARLAYELGMLDLRALVKVRNRPAAGVGVMEGEDWMETTPGRIIFNDSLPDELGFYNTVIDKGVLKDITSQAHENLGSEKTALILDSIKDLGFSYASKAGITIAISDVEVPSEKAEIVGNAEARIDRLTGMYMDGLVTEEERYRQAVEIWTDANDRLTSAVDNNMSRYGGMRSDEDKEQLAIGEADGESVSGSALSMMSNSGIGLYMMATSGAKGNIAQIKQMAGMRGLMSDPKGRIIDRPIKSSFREGLSVLEYFISTHGARKGLTDTALRTADSGYLTRRLIDVAQELIVLEEDCGTLEGLWIGVVQGDGESNSMMPPFVDKAKSRYAATPVADSATGEIIVNRDELLTTEILDRIVASGAPGAFVRTPLKCDAKRGLCRMCYGLSLATWKPVLVGEAVGIVAAQSIGEPGTQLTMRTFHTGGIAGSDITSGLPRVQELFEARVPKGEAVLSEIEGTVEMGRTTVGRVVRVKNTDDPDVDVYMLTDEHSLRVQDGDLVTDGTLLAVADGGNDGGDSTALMQRDDVDDIVASMLGIVEIDKEAGLLTVSWTEEEEREYQIPASATIIVNDGDKVGVGDPLTGGPKNPQLVLALQGGEAVQQYMIDEVQRVYRSQGVTIHDKHIEVIVSQMLRKVEVVDAGDTNLLEGDQIDRKDFDERNNAVLAEGGDAAVARPVLLGITRASLKMESFLSAASFQETTRVLTEAAVNSSVDNLRGLKENVIIGRLIPARLDLTEEGRAFLDMPEEEETDALSSPWRNRMRMGMDIREEMSRGPLGMEVPQSVEGALEEQERTLQVGDD